MDIAGGGESRCIAFSASKGLQLLEGEKRFLEEARKLLKQGKRIHLTWNI
eukprot:CAMPEP_0185027660 /NCGR_PEP_ID=MMETSP1103-20130426/12906_1 /TAXON_ID=36769 /ORGANISM="Paraphysomonas bandaiensis, Strain Caron Lab Isolate" /LENGTH=49 /DNA_ID=CAMNT_0027561763 /DNA_START=93 /DNA_END=242 /DNA_ORIENTATION=+